MKHAKTKSLLEYLGIGLSAGLLGLVILVALAAIVVPKVAGATPATILTSSMEPTLPPGTLVIVKPVPLHQIRIGDVMTYQLRSGDPAVVSHRVVAITRSTTGGLTFTTKGDNNAEKDAPVIPAQVRGVVWYSVPLLGFVNSAIDHGQRSWIVPALGVLLLLYSGYMILRAALAPTPSRRRAHSAAATSGDDPGRPLDARPEVGTAPGSPL
ncbi:signal peptidase I [Leifsonia sp. fls2-241-R2A-40a]|uniref:signal peptidase I n=1 Tax=Leifsonia sp. fls2-241-R2A-40a TaxID=3040290 RepID=UPI00254DFCCE|nr:signal peptidase I [Leifsonia sp. fls2-241-R2A-40a]